MPNDTSKGSYETLREKLNLNKADEAETTDSSQTFQGELELTSKTNKPTKDTNEATTTGSSFDLDPVSLEKHKTLTMWEAVDEAKRLVTQSRGMNKESAKLAEETQDIRDEMLEDRKALGELVKKQGVLLQSQTKMQENLAAIIERQHQVIEQQKTAHKDLLHRLDQFEEDVSDIGEKISGRVEVRFVDYAIAIFFGVGSFVLIFQVLGPRVVAWVGSLLRG